MSTELERQINRELELLRDLGAEVALLREYLAWRQANRLLPTRADRQRLHYWGRLAKRHGRMLACGHSEGYGGG